MAESSARQEYQRLLDECVENRQQYDGYLARLVWVRTALFLLAAFLLVTSFVQAEAPTWYWGAGWVAAAVFFVVIVANEQLRLKSVRFRREAELYQRLLARLDRQWNKLPEESLLEGIEISCADDLDVAGRSSLLSLINLATSLPGRKTMQEWIGQPPQWHEVLRRQRAVSALLPLREFRLRLMKEIRQSCDGSEDMDGLPAWAHSPNWIRENRLAYLLSLLGPFLVAIGLVGLVVATSAGNRQWMTGAAICVGCGFAVNILLTIVWGSWIHGIFHKVTGGHGAASSLASVFAEFAELPNDAASSDQHAADTGSLDNEASERLGILQNAKKVATEGDDSAVSGFSSLLRLVRLANLQRDPTLYLLYLVLQLLTAWDVRILGRLEAWKTRFGSSVPRWFEALGQYEAVSSLATLADENPDDWTFPKPPNSDAELIFASELGHPLLPPASCVRNDLDLRDDKPLLLVTGSNMAGKSTFMRSIGLNLLLARLGGPVCAKEMRTHLFEIASSIRVRDSLSDGVSFFMAELKRLKEVVDQAADHRAEGRAPIFYLLDEILQGTNSRERQIAVATVLEKLQSFGAQGILSTHDLDLAVEPTVERISQIVHFREYFVDVGGKEEMQFDFKMRPGPTPTTNALKLLKLVGLG